MSEAKQEFSGGATSIQNLKGLKATNMQQQRPPQQHPGQRPPQQHPGQRPPQQHPGQRPPQQHPGQRPPQQHPGQRPPQQHPGQRPPQGPNSFYKPQYQQYYQQQPSPSVVKNSNMVSFWKRKDFKESIIVFAIFFCLNTPRIFSSVKTQMPGYLTGESIISVFLLSIIASVLFYFVNLAVEKCTRFKK